MFRHVSSFVKIINASIYERFGVTEKGACYTIGKLNTKRNHSFSVWDKIGDFTSVEESFEVRSFKRDCKSKWDSEKCVWKILLRGFKIISRVPWKFVVWRRRSTPQKYDNIHDTSEQQRRYATILPGIIQWKQIETQQNDHSHNSNDTTHPLLHHHYGSQRFQKKIPQNSENDVSSLLHVLSCTNVDRF